MIAHAHESVVDWISAAVPDVPVECRPPKASGNVGAPASIVCYLFNASPASPPRGMRRGPLQYDLSFLVLPEFADPLAGYRALDALIGSAAERADIELIDAGLTPQFWNAFGTLPAPALTVRISARWERVQSPAPQVLHPLIVRTTDLTRLHGRVTTADGSPVAGAEVRLPGTVEAPARTGRDGRFSLPAAPASAADGAFVVRARGHLHTITAQPPDADAARTASDILLIIDPIGVMT